MYNINMLSSDDLASVPDILITDYRRWDETEEFDGWTREQIKIFLSIVFANIVDQRLINLTPGQRLDECFHVNARVGFQRWSSVVYKHTEGVLEVHRLAEVPRVFEYNSTTGVNLYGPSFGFVMPHTHLVETSESGDPLLSSEP